MAERVCLVVDDEPAIRAFVRAVLGTQKVHCVEAETACEALRTVHHLNGKIDLVISDIQMPGDINGIDLAYSLRYTFPRLPVVLISGSWEEEQSARAAARQFLTKPVPVTTLVKVIQELPSLHGETEPV